MKNKKILIFATTAYMIKQFNKPVIELLKSMDYAIEVACNFEVPGPMNKASVEEFKNYLEQQDINYYQIDIPRSPIHIMNIIRSFNKTKNLIKLNNYDIIHSHSPTGGLVGRLAARKFRKNGLISIYTAHGFHFHQDAPLKNWLIFYPVEKIMSYFTDILITINQDDFKISKEKLKAVKVEYVPGVGVNLEKFKRSTSNNLYDELNLSKNDFILTYVAELNNNKNQILLIKTIKKLLKINDEFKLLLVGTGPNKKDYENYIKKNNLEQNVLIMGYRTDVVEILSITDVYVASSKREGLPVNVIEAMAIGLPILATNIRGHRDLVQNNKNGYLLKTKSDEFYLHILKLYKDNEKRNSFSQYSSKIVEEYSTENIKNKLKLFYTQHNNFK